MVAIIFPHMEGSYLRIKLKWAKNGKKWRQKEKYLLTFSKLNKKIITTYFTKFYLFSATNKQMKQYEYSHGILSESLIKGKTGQVQRTVACLGG